MAKSTLYELFRMFVHDGRRRDCVEFLWQWLFSIHACAQHKQACRVEGSSTRDDVSKQTLRAQARESEILAGFKSNTNLSGRDHRGGPTRREPRTDIRPQHPCSVSGLFCASQAKRASYTAAALYHSTPSSPFSPSVGRGYPENAMRIIPHANLSHVLTASGYHVMP